MTPTFFGLGHPHLGGRDGSAPREGSAAPVAALHLANFFDSVLAGEGEVRPYLRVGVQDQRLSLRDAYSRLTIFEQARLKNFIPPEVFEELLALSHETDAGMFFEGMISLGIRLNQNHRSDLAMAILSSVQQAMGQEFPGRPANHAALGARAGRELDAILGRGAIGARVEHLGRGLAQEASNPVMLASMGVAGFAFSTVRMGMLSRLLTSSSEGFFFRGFGARALASTVGFAAEVPAFVFSGRGLNEALGVHQDWSLSAVGRELATAGITLSTLKLSGAAARGILGRMEGNSALERMSRAALPQFAMLGGVMAGHRLEETVGLRRHVDGATTLVDSLSTLLQFHVSGRLLNHAMGPEYARFQQELEYRSEMMGRMPRAQPPSGDRPPIAEVLRGMFFLHRPAVAGVGAVEGREGGELRLPHVFMIEGKGDGNGKENGSSRPSSRPRVTPPERLTPLKIGPTPMELALAEAAKAPRGTREIRVGEPPAKPPVDAASQDDLRFDLVPDAAAAPNGESRPTMASVETPLAPPPAPPPATQRSELPISIPTLVNGQRLGPEGRFQVQARLSAGGSGTVYRVIDTRSGRVAAIKVPRGQNRPEDLERFRREIWISENLASGWAVPIYDHFEILPKTGIQVPLMEFVDGIELGRILHRIGLNDTKTLQEYPLERRLDLFADLCLGVHDAHQHGISHNDLKPDNLMVDRNVRMRILDWGLARHVAQTMSGNRHGISPEAMELRPERVSHSLGAGTPGYMAPETTHNESGPNPRSQDIFSLGVILYEIATAQHPFGRFVPGDEASGQPKLVPVRHDRRPDGMPELNMRSALTYGKDVSAEPPKFADLLVGEQPPYLSELEGIARLAMHPDPKQRMQSASELREAVLMSRARAERARLGELRRQMRESAELTKASWRQFNVASKIDPAQWTSMHQLIGRLREMRESWHQGVEELVIRLKEVTKYENIPAARRMIAEISYERLVDGGDRMAEAVRQSLIRRIRENDVPVREECPLSFGGLLDGEAGIALSFRDLEAGAGISREASSNARARIYSLIRERDAEGHEMGSYRRGELVQEGRWIDLQGKARLAAGYYVMELEVPGYHADPVPLQVRPQAVYSYLVDGQPMIVPVELVREGRLNPGLTLVQGGRSTTGFDFYQDGIPSNVYSFPTHEIELPTFAISRKPVTVGEYQDFIESMLSEGRIDEVRTYLPRKNTPPQRISRDLFRDTWRVYREEGFRAAFEHFLNRQRGYSYYWKVRPEGFGPWKRYRLTDPSSHADPNGDPIIESQPISAITYHAAEAYAAWRSEREGRVYDLPTAEEKEKVDRNSFPWNFPWGYDFAPFHLISRLAFSGELKATTYPQPVGQHLMEQKYYRDQTLYGTVDNLGNVREFTSSQGEPEYVVLSGGSVRVPYGPFYYPASRNYAHRRNAVDDSVGAFRLVLRFGRPRPQDHSAEPPPVQE